VDGTGPVEGEEEVRWKELRRQAWEGLGWKSLSGWEGRRGLRGRLQEMLAILQFAISTSKPPAPTAPSE
jgi:hypothetical protein